VRERAESAAVAGCTAAVKDGSGKGKQEGATSSTMTLSGASGQYLAAELAALRARSKATERRRLSLPSVLEPEKTWAIVQEGVVAVYDRPFSAFFNFVYDVLQLSSGRDKFCALMQGYAKFASAALSRPDSERHFMYRGIEDSLSDGRKVFRLFKEQREVYKVRRGLHRMSEGIAEDGFLSVPAVCGFLDTIGHTCSFFYYLFDNILWAASVGIVRSKEIPRWQQKMWQGNRRNGAVLLALGGVEMVKLRRNKCSIYRLVCGFIANLLLLRKAVESCARKRSGEFQGPDDPRLFHTIELAGMAANFRILWSKLGFRRETPQALGLLAMLASACGIWVNWRKVRRKNCGTKEFPKHAISRRQSSLL